MLGNIYLSRSPTLIYGINYVICIDNENNVWGFGENSQGYVGQKPSELCVFPPKKISDLSNIKSISCGYHHSICLDYDGNLFSFGSNVYGQLGIGLDAKEKRYSYSPQKIDLPPIDKISSGAYFNICLTFDGLLYAFGKNSKGELGIGSSSSNICSPVLLDIKDVTFIECGIYFSLCKTIDNEYYVWGDNNFGQLGLNDSTIRNKPSINTFMPDNIVSIKSGVYHTLLLTSNGDVYSYGRNNNGQLGFLKSIIFKQTPTKIDLPEIRMISCGYEHSMCVDMDDKLWVFGYNNYGQLGLKNDIYNQFTPILNTNISDVIDISYEGDHTIIKTHSNEIYACGSNRSSQLGLPASAEKQKIPIQVLKDMEDIWTLNLGTSRAKSARK